MRVNYKQSLYRTYEELKQLDIICLRVQGGCLYRTYEELKHGDFPFLQAIHDAFVSYL